MPYFQNVFNQDHILSISLGDRNYSPDFKIKANRNQSHHMVAWVQGPYDFSGTDAGGVTLKKNLTFKFSLDYGKTWASLTIDITAGAVDSTKETVYEVAAALNANATFAGLFTASVQGGYVVIDSTLANKTTFKAYLANSGAESVLRFNYYAGVAELPRYASRHTIDNIPNYPDSWGSLIQLSGSAATEGSAGSAPSGVDVQIITDAGLDASVVHTDYYLFGGCAGILVFRQNTLDGSGRITQTIEYPAGAKKGDLAKKVLITYSGAFTNPTTYAEIPYVLTQSDVSGLTP